MFYYKKFVVTSYKQINYVFNDSAFNVMISNYVC